MKKQTNNNTFLFVPFDAFVTQNFNQHYSICYGGVKLSGIVIAESEGPVADLKCHSLNRASVESRRLITTSYEHFVCGLLVACINHAKCQLDQIRMTKTCWLYLHLFVIHVTLKWGHGHWNWCESVISHTHTAPPPPPTHTLHTHTPPPHWHPPPSTHTHTW